MRNPAEVLLRMKFRLQTVTKDASVRTEQFNMKENAFELMNALALYAVKHSRLAVKSKKIATHANAKKEFGNAQIKHAEPDAVQSEIHIIKLSMENILISWENVHIIF